MNHPINPLTNDGLTFLYDRLTDFTVAYEGLYLDPQRDQAPVMERCARILPTDLYNELVAYLHSMHDHVAAVSFVLYGDNEDLRADGLVADSPDDCPPHGIALADDAIVRYRAQFDRGLLTTTEFDDLIARYWHAREMDGAEGIEKVQWMYDHGLLDVEAFWSAIEECWVEHIAAMGENRFDANNCGMCSCASADEYRNAYLTAMYPQMTGAPAVSEPGEPG